MISEKDRKSSRIRPLLRSMALVVGMSSALPSSTGAPSFHPQDFCIFDYGPAEVSPVLANNMLSTGNIEEGMKPVEGGTVYTAADDVINETQYRDYFLRANMDCVILSWYPDQRAKYFEYYADFLGSHPDNQLKYTFEYELLGGEEPTVEQNRAHLEVLSQHFSDPNFYTDQNGIPTFFVFAKAAEGLIDNPGYVEEFAGLAAEFNARAILEDYPLNYLNPFYNDPNIGWIGYDSEPWDLRPSGIYTTKDTTRLLNAYDKWEADRDLKQLPYDENRLVQTIDRAKYLGRPIVTIVSSSEMVEGTNWNSGIVDVYAQHIPAN